MSGRLVLVGTPIGNLGDLSPRAVEALTEADLVCCEDTRRTGRLLEQALGRSARLRRLDGHTEEAAIASVCRLLADGRTVAVVSDAGMPTLCDPGSMLVAAAAAAGHTVTVIPGPSAGLAALAVSGLPAARHVFEGFLPRKGSARTERLLDIAGERRTVVLFEAPSRLRSSLTDLAAVCGGDRQAVIAREMTKMHEQVMRGTLDELLSRTDGPVRGEVVIVIAGAPAAADPGRNELLAALDSSLGSGMSLRDAAIEVATDYGISRRRVYELGLARHK